jgi:HK97 family phage major capsid protein
VVASESGENSTNSAQNAPTFNMVTLQARPVTAYAAIPRKLVQVSAPSIADAWTRSVARAFAKYEDDSALTGANSYAGRGLGDLTGANFSRFDNAGSAWTDWAIEDITQTIGKLGGRAWTAESPNLPPIICSANFYSSVLRRFALSAGGTTGQSILAGFGNVPESANATFDNHPVYFTSSMPTSFSANQNVAFVGGFSQAGMVGEMLGGLEIDMSEHAGFYQDQLVFRAVSHIAINNHSADDEAEPMVVSFYD